MKFNLVEILDTNKWLLLLGGAFGEINGGGCGENVALPNVLNATKRSLMLPKCSTGNKGSH